MYGTGRSTVTRAVREIRPLLAARGFAVPEGQRLKTMADVFAYAAEHGITLRMDGTEVQVRRPKAKRPGRRAFVSGKKKMEREEIRRLGRQCQPLLLVLHRVVSPRSASATRPQSRPRGSPTSSLDFPRSASRYNAGYRGLAKEFPNQVHAPPKKPKKDATPEEVAAYEEQRHKQSSERICVEHANADLKKWRPLQRYLGNRDDFDETFQAIAGLVSDRAAAR